MNPRRYFAALFGVCAFLSLACFGGGGGTEDDGGGSISVKVRNDYAESLFAASVTYKGSTDRGPVTLFSGERIGGNSSRAFEGVVDPQTGETALFFHVVGTSLGREHAFTATIPLDGRKSGTLLFTYDYDFAAADFRLTHRWEPGL